MKARRAGLPGVYTRTMCTKPMKTGFLLRLTRTKMRTKASPEVYRRPGIQRQQKIAKDTKKGEHELTADDTDRGRAEFNAKTQSRVERLTRQATLAKNQLTAKYTKYAKKGESQV
jgi:hypothetical protein